MRTIEIGQVKIHLENDEDPAELLKTMFRPLSNKEMAGMIGISERSVLRWKSEGRLPTKPKGQVNLIDLLRYLGGESQAATENGEKH